MNFFYSKFKHFQEFLKHAINPAYYDLVMIFIYKYTVNKYFNTANEHNLVIMGYWTIQTIQQLT